MNTHLLALELMAAQGILGAFDTLYHHELTEALPQRSTARLELSIHSIRALIYSVMFIGLSAWQWNGSWVLILMGLFGIEIVLTLWDFVIEDRTRLLPATERVTHTILAINGGAFIALLAINAPEWLAEPSGLVWEPYGFLSFFLFLCGIGVGLSGMRDGFAVFQMGKNIRRDKQLAAISFSDNAESVLVTGATGFIGQKLVAALLADGQQVSVLTRNLKKAAWMFDGQVRCISNMSDLPAKQKIDVIINLAGARILGWRWSKRRKRVLRSSRIGLTESVVQWIAQAEHKPRLLVSASAIGYYGIQALGDDTVLTEDSPSSSIFMSQLCQDWEGAAQAAAEYGVQVKCMRFGLVLGHQGALPMMMLPIKLGLGGPLGTGRQWLSWIHVYDLLRGIAHLWQLDGQSDGQSDEQQADVEVYNFTAPEAVMQKQFSEIAGQVIRRPSAFSTPGKPMRIALGEQSDLLLEGQRVEPGKLKAEGFEFMYPDVRSALQSLY
ncbi:Putative sugar nucleotide epimerase [hydrothermal vent metagenome]|uniref:Sugar nucleotide epimerase n=1 Tax=hydrothermal vent metagenome TaxID=652676 RepID=A0A3B0XX13_9ZZZZ